MTKNNQSWRLQLVDLWHFTLGAKFCYYSFFKNDGELKLRVTWKKPFKMLLTLYIAPLKEQISFQSLLQYTSYITLNYYLRWCQCPSDMLIYLKQWKIGVLKTSCIFRYVLSPPPSAPKTKVATYVNSKLSLLNIHVQVNIVWGEWEVSVWRQMYSK